MPTRIGPRSFQETEILPVRQRSFACQPLRDPDMGRDDRGRITPDGIAREQRAMLDGVEDPAA